MFEGFFKNFGFSRDAFRSAYPEGICARKATKDKGERRRKSAKDNFEMGSRTLPKIIFDEICVRLVPIRFVEAAFNPNSPP